MSNEHDETTRTRQSQSVWDAQDQNERSSIGRTDSEVDGTSQQHEHQSVTIDRTNHQGRGDNRLSTETFNGKILSQLIASTRSQLAKSRDCIKWYEEEVAEFEKQLEELEKLKELENHQDSSQSP